MALAKEENFMLNTADTAESNNATICWESSSMTTTFASSKPSSPFLKGVVAYLFEFDPLDLFY